MRKRSVESVLAEIEDFRTRYDLKFIYFDDDIFALPKDWFRSFAKVYEQKIRIPYFCYMHVNLIDEELVGLLKSSGCRTVSIGIEVADQELRAGLLGRHMNNEDIIKASKLIKSHGMQLKTSNLIGVPGTSLRTDMDTIRLNHSCKPDYTSVAILQPYPGTAIKDMIAKNDHLKHQERSQRELSHLQFLFGFFVRFQVGLFMLPFLVRLPLTKVYKFGYLLSEGYCAFFKLYPAGRKTFYYGIKRYLKLFWQGCLGRPRIKR